MFQFGHYLSSFLWETAGQELRRQTNARGREWGLSFDCDHWYCDDTAKVGPPEFLDSDRPIARAIAGGAEPGIAGTLVFESTKFQSSRSSPDGSATHGGIVYDIPRWRIFLTLRRFARALVTIWIVAADFNEVGKLVPERVMQALFAHASQLARYTKATYLRGFARALIRDVSHFRRENKCLHGRIPFARSSLDALNALRAWTIYAVRHPSILCLGIDRVPLLYLPDKSNLTQLLEDQEKAADITVYSDASLSHRTVGVWIPGSAWLSYSLPSSAQTDFFTINVLELLGMVLGSALALATQPNLGAPHLHRWSDSAVALAQSQRSSALNPLPLHLILFEQALLASRSAFLTQGHIEGINNVVTDAISRRFTTNRSPEATLSLASCAEWTTSPAWQESLDRFCRDCASAPSSPGPISAMKMPTGPLLRRCSERG